MEEIDPEIAARHKAVFDDLANEIDGLESDDEGGSSPPQPVHKAAPKGGSVNKKFKLEPKEDDDLDFPKFDNTAYNEMQKGLNMKNDFADLEKEILGLDSEEEEGSVPVKKQVQKSVKEAPAVSKQPSGTGTAPHKALSGSASFAAGISNQAKVSAPAQTQAAAKSTKTTGASFPFNHFSGGENRILIALDTKLHGKDALMTLGLVNYEIEEIIDPCLESSSINDEMKKHLETKKKSLLTFKDNIVNLFKQGKLNSAKYIGLVAQMKKKNMEITQEIQKSNATKELARVKERLRILLEEEKEYMNKGEGASAMPISTKTETKKKESSLSDSLKYVPETKINKMLPSEIDHLSSEELSELLKKRKNQYWNLAMYINKEILKYLEGNELAQKKQYLQSKLIPVIQKASKFIETFETQDSSDIAEFLKDELLEVTPALLHGKSLKERSADIEKLVQMLEACSTQESDYVEKLRATLDDPSQAMGASGKKVKEGEKLIEKYGEYIEYLTKLNSDKFMWVPTPKVTVGKEQRTVSLMNKEVDAKAMYVRFKGLEKVDKRKYFIRWHVETASGNTTFNTEYCDENSLQFNYQQTVQMTTKEKLDPNIENKEIRVEIIYKQMFMEKKKAEGTIPLAGFRKSNTLEGKAKLGDGAELNYLLKVREPLLKHLRTDVMTVHSFQTFTAFDKDAVVIQAPPTEKKPVQASTQEKAVEERKTQEPAPAAASGGGKLFEKRKYPPLVLLPQANDPLASLSQGEVPAGVSLEQAKDPCNPDLINCLGVLKAMAEELEKARTGLAAEGRRADNKVVSENWAKALKKATILEGSFGEGEIDPVQYCDMLKSAIEVDQKLANLYKAKGDNDRLIFVQEKLKMTMKELKDMEEAIAAEGDS